MRFVRYVTPFVAAVALALSMSAGAQAAAPSTAFSKAMVKACSNLPALPTAWDTAKTMKGLQAQLPVVKKVYKALVAFYNTPMPSPPAAVVKQAQALNTDFATFVKLLNDEIKSVESSNLSSLRTAATKMGKISPNLEAEFKAIGAGACW